VTNKLVCEVHSECTEPVVAKIGLPSAKALWVCLRGFHEFRAKKEVSS
jgi:hypothetical protein